MTVTKLRSFPALNLCGEVKVYPTLHVQCWKACDDPQEKVVRMKVKIWTLIASTMLLSAVCSTAEAKRLPPPQVPPVVIGGVRYSAPNDDGLRGYIQVSSVETGRKIRTITLYRVKLRPMLERDVQDVFISRLEARPGRLLVTDERQRHYTVDLRPRRFRLHH